MSRGNRSYTRPCLSPGCGVMLAANTPTGMCSQHRHTDGCLCRPCTEKRARLARVRAEKGRRFTGPTETVEIVSIGTHGQWNTHRITLPAFPGRPLQETIE